MKILLLILISSPLISQVTLSTTQDPSTFIINENFNDLNNWENFSFSGDKNPTQYSIVKDSTRSYLKIISHSAASGLIHKFQFDPNKYPVMKWQWRIDNLIEGADGKAKSGDDYPLRIFIMFDDDSAETSFWKSIQNSAVKLLYGTDLPESSLCFVWANIEYEVNYFDNPYSDTVKMIPVSMGYAGIKQWRSHEVNIVDYFKKIFGRSCPLSAKLAIMSDTDNTKSRTESGLDYIRIYSD